MTQGPSTQQSSWLDRPLLTTITVNWELILFSGILLLAAVSRFYELGVRVMSHDETTHVYFSWQLFRGQGYAHSPLSHGPLQFHLIALSYFLFGDSDFTARIPMALFSIGTVAFAWAFRRYLGRIGALVTALLLLISPFMLYYGRYARNEAFVGLFGLVTLWAILRYLDRGENKYLYILTAATALHFTAKETSFIYTAQALLFLGILFLWRIRRRAWGRADLRRYFFTAFSATAALAVAAVGAGIYLPSDGGEAISATEVVEPVVPGEVVPSTVGMAAFCSPEGANLESAAEAPQATLSLQPLTLGLIGLTLVAAIVMMALLVRGYGWERLRRERSFNLMVLLFTLVLPHLAAFPITWLGRDPLNYSDVDNVLVIGAVLVALGLISGLLGVLWDQRVWLINLGIFYAIFIPLFTTIFTNTNGFFSGIVGSLGYWLEQQGVQRGNQPPYYYWGVQIPIYEYLAAAGTLLAARFGWKRWVILRKAGPPAEDVEDRNLRPAESRAIALALIAFWFVTALIAYTLAGEKMPWLTYHIALPMLLLSGWSFGKLIRAIDWARLGTRQGAATILLSIVFIFALLATLGALLGTMPPFRGLEQVNLQATNRFIFRLGVTVLSGWGLLRLRGFWPRRQFGYVFTALALSGLALLTTRSAYRAAFINYDEATEYLVYAHMARGPKEIIEQVDELSQRITDGDQLLVAYDNETTYPFWWYLRNYPNQRFYGEQPGRDLREAPVILVGDTNYGKLEPIVGNAYYEFEYNRIWWPNQDYFDFTRSSLGFNYTSETGQPAEAMPTGEYLRRVALKLWDWVDDAPSREGLYDIWMHRDFTRYFEARGQNFDLSNWSPSRTMRMYIRKDIAAQIWDFGVEPAAEAAIADPYEGRGIELAADLSIGQPGSAEGQFNAPRGLVIAPDGSLYVADAENHRIQHLDAEGNVLNSWGEFADISTGEAPGGTFFEPWGVAVSPDGRFVYVADTWNHRIQKFTAAGRFLLSWGTFGQGEDPEHLWGPRDLVVDAEGNVLVTDTGNKRIRIYDPNGEYIGQYGAFGFELGHFDEPVGLALDEARGRLYVADTWNQRVQVLDYSDGVLQAVDEWPITGWFGQSLQNKPYLAVGADGHVYISDPEAGRVLVYEADGAFVHFWGGFDQQAVLIGIAQGIEADSEGRIWLTDSQNGVLLRFDPPR